MVRNIIIVSSVILLFLIGLSWVIINRLMSPEWRQERRNREIRRAVAARQALLAETRPANEATAADKDKESPPSALV